MLPLAGAGWLACALGTWARPSAWLVVGGLGLAVLILVITRNARATWLAAVVPALLVATVMVGAVALGTTTRDQVALVALEGEHSEATVRLTATFMPGDKSVPGTLVALAGEALARGPIPVRVIGDLGDTRRALGSEVVLRAQLVRSDPWDHESWLLFVEPGPALWQQPGRFLVATDALRQTFSERSAALGGDGGRLLPGLAIGDTSAVDPGLTAAMQATSLSHLVAVSGANCAVVVAIVVAIVALCGGGVWPRMIAGVLALVGFVALVTPEPGIIRAAIMASIVLVFLAASKPVRGIPVLCTTVLLLLAWNPWLSTDFAFALSVFATGGILLAVTPLTAALSTVLHPAIALVVALPIAAQVACQPLLILLNPVIPLWGVLANALAAPVAPVATILGMLACVLGPLVPAIADALTAVAWVPSSYIAGLGRVLAGTGTATIPWPSGWWGAVATGVIGYGALAWLVIRRSDHRVRTRVLGSMASTTLIAVILLYFVPSWAVRASVPEAWTVAQCDVGQGDALVFHSEGAYALIDAGEFPDRLEECFALLGVQHLDLVVLTHFDKDHVSGWPALVGITGELWTGPPENEADQRIIDALVAGGATHRQVTKGHDAALGGYALSVVWPDTAPLGSPGNDSSVVLEVRPSQRCSQCLSGLFLGDLGERAQQILAARERFRPVDIVKVSHHGSADQYQPLYEALGASVGLIGVGAENTYGHPAPSLLSALPPVTTMVRSDLNGTATLHRSDGGGIVMWSER
jgi:competence protein ComEC